MVCKEEVFNWFKEASGAKRIELMCGLMSMCIPLEIRFFEAIVQDLAKKDYKALKEAELKANSFQEMDTICRCNLLADKMVDNMVVSDKVIAVTNSEPNVIQSHSSSHTTNAHTSKPQVMPVMPIQDMCVSANGNVSAVAVAAHTTTMNTMNTMNTTMSTNNEMMANASHGTHATHGTPAPPPANLSLLPARSKLIVSLCLLSPTNYLCSNLAFKALRTQLTAKNISGVVSHCFFSKGCVNFDDLFSEVMLMLTMAVHHPAFTFEQRDILAKQKDDVGLTIDSVNTQFRQTNFSTAQHYPPFHAHTHLHHHQYTHYISIPTSNLGYSTPSNQMPAVLPNQMSNLRITNMTSPVSSPSPTNSPQSSKTNATSVATISPLHFPQELPPHVLAPPHIANPENPVNPTAPYVLTTALPLTSPNVIEDMGCAKSIVSCYNCGSIGHRGDECTAQTQDEATR